MTSGLLQVLADAVPATLWRNGGGSTRELLTRPSNADWRLRISLADIERDGPFSNFPGTQRWFAVVAGAGVRLRFASSEHIVTADSAALRFDGAAAPECELLDGSTRDLNLMLREGSAALQRVQPEATWDDAFAERGLFTLCAGDLHSEADGITTLAPFTLVWYLRPGACRFMPRSEGRAGWWLGWSDAPQQGASS